MKAGYVSDKAALQNRLKRLEGQVRGIQRMVDEERYCIDVLTQVNAIKAGLDGVAVLLLKDHVEHCVADAIENGTGAEKLKELTAAVSRYVSG